MRWITSGMSALRPCCMHPWSEGLIALGVRGPSDYPALAAWYHASLLQDARNSCMHAGQNQGLRTPGRVMERHACRLLAGGFCVLRRHGLSDVRAEILRMQGLQAHQARDANPGPWYTAAGLADRLLEVDIYQGECTNLVSSGQAAVEKWMRRTK